VNTLHTHIWCDACQRIQPLQIVDLHKDDATGHYTNASDVHCGSCGYLIATLYLPKPGIAALGRHSP
jgi:hypothetical protein